MVNFHIAQQRRLDQCTSTAIPSCFPASCHHTTRSLQEHIVPVSVGILHELLTLASGSSTSRHWNLTLPRLCASWVDVAEEGIMFCQVGSSNCNGFYPQPEAHFRRQRYGKGLTICMDLEFQSLIFLPCRQEVHFTPDLSMMTVSMVAEFVHQSYHAPMLAAKV